MNKKNIAFTFFTVIIVLILAEIVFGLAFWYKDALGLRHKPYVKDAPYLYYFQDFKSNLTPVKDSGKFRIAIVGGSAARQFGALNFLDSVLNYKLKTSCIEVFNAGVDGYVVQQEFILTQLMVQKYNPDMIIGIDGYNDMMSYKLNRYINEYATICPQNYRDFRVIEKGKMEKKFYSRFLYLFKNTLRAAEFFGNMISGKSSNDYSMVTDTELIAYGGYYSGVVNDLNDFCKVKGIRYLNFVQPVRFYDSNSENSLRNNQGIEKLARLYSVFENRIVHSGFGYSLTTVFDRHQDVYKDDCHVNENGNKLLAEAIAGIVITKLEQDTVFLKLSGNAAPIVSPAQNE
jgi:hypothetical protein